MKILVTGATGFVGSLLVDRLKKDGAAIRVVSRNPRRAQRRLGRDVEAVSWSEKPERLASGCQAVVHLAGESILGRWTEEKKEKIRSSRVKTTTRLVEALAAAEERPTILVSASAVGYYGDRGDETLTERSSPGSGFLADVCREWESAALSAAGLGVRTVCLRIGVVLGPGGGALEKMVPAFKAFAGGPVGSGSQWMSWIHREDVCGLFQLALTQEEVSGPMNATAPLPATNRELSAAVGRALGRPSWLPLPSPVVKILFGEGASILLEGQRVLPDRATDLGYRFRYPSLDDALRACNL